MAEARRGVMMARLFAPFFARRRRRHLFIKRESVSRVKDLARGGDMFAVEYASA